MLDDLSYSSLRSLSSKHHNMKRLRLNSSDKGFLENVRSWAFEEKIAASPFVSAKLKKINEEKGIVFCNQ